MAEGKKFSELLADAEIDYAKFSGKTARIGIDINGEKDCIDLFIQLGMERIARQFVFLNSDDPEILDEDPDDDFFDEDDYGANLELVDDFFENAKVSGCNCQIELDLVKKEPKSALLGIAGTYKGENTSHFPIELEGYELELSREDVELLLSLVAQHRTQDEISYGNYKEEIRSLLWCDCVDTYVAYIKNGILPDLKEPGSGVRLKVCNSSNPGPAPKWGEARRYTCISVSEEYHDRFDQIYEFCMNDPNLNDGTFAGDRDFCLTKNDGGSRMLVAAIANVMGTKPCKYILTSEFEKILKRLKDEFYDCGVVVSSPYLYVEEKYSVKKSKEIVTCRNSYQDLRCPGCTNKLGLFSKYSDFICEHGIYLTFSKR